MARKKSSALRSGTTPTPLAVNVLNINGNLYSLGDLRKADFSELEDPAASVKSLVAWAKQLNRILKGVSAVTDASSLAKAAGVPDATSFSPIISALSSKGITANSTVQDAVNAVS